MISKNRDLKKGSRLRMAGIIIGSVIVLAVVEFAIFNIVWINLNPKIRR